MTSSDEHLESDELEQLVAGYVQRLNAGERIEPTDVLLRHPRRGEDILAQLQLYVGPAWHGRETEPLGTLGDYTLRRQIGRGGMGVVYEAWQTSDEPCAWRLKVLPCGQSLLDDRSRSTRFMQRGSHLQASSTIPTLFRFTVWARSNSRPPITRMDYVEGETLAQVLAQAEGRRSRGAETAFGHKDRAQPISRKSGPCLRRRRRRTAARSLQGCHPPRYQAVQSDFGQ